MGWTTIVGLVLGFGAVILSTTLEGGSVAHLANLPGAVIVFGGTFGVALVAFPPQVTLRLPKIIMQVFQQKLPDRGKTIEMLVELADKARRQGLLSLEEEGAKLTDTFTKKGVQLVVDGTAPEVTRHLLENDTAAMSERHAANYAVLEAMGGYAPTMGIIGTVMGLVNVLGRLGGDPSELGGAIATAFLATFYGVGSANLLWLPLASKLKKVNEEEVLLRDAITEGLLALQAGDNPRIVRMKLEAFLSPGDRSKEGAETAGAAEPRVA